MRARYNTLQRERGPARAPPARYHWFVTIFACAYGALFAVVAAVAYLWPADPVRRDDA